MFDTKTSDHILEGEEALGWALQGTYVYKEGVSGSRTGYADFYNKCLEEYQNSELYTEAWTQPVAKGDTTAIDGGDMVITASSYSGTTWNPYKAFDNISSSVENGWAIGGTGNAGWWQVKFPYKIKITGLKYYRRYSQNADNATSGRFYTSSDKSVAIGDKFSVSTGTLAEYSIDIANIPADGIITDTIYLATDAITNSYAGMDYLKITAERVLADGLLKNPNGHLFYDIANKAAVDNIFATTGMAWMYGVDEENERIFLPRNNFFFQLAGDTSQVGDSVEAGLPNITGVVDAFGSWGASGTGAFTVEWTSGNFHKGGTEASNYKMTLDASRSNAIYGNSDTVQPNAVKQLLYICVGNTKVESAVSNVTEITTSENDTLPLFHNFYSKEDMTTTGAYVNASLGSWLSGNVYTTAYNELVNKLGTDNVKSVTDSYTDYDFVVNQDDMTFRLPLLNGEEDLIGGKSVNYTFTGFGQTIIAPANGWLMMNQKAGVENAWMNIYNKTQNFKEGDFISASTASLRVHCFASAGDELEVTGNATGDVWEFRFIYAQGNGNLYYKLSNAVENLELLDVGKVMNEAVLKSSLGEVKVVTETYRNGWSWYRVYSDGWCEQGGYYDVGGHTIGTVSLLKPYKHADYSLICIPAGMIDNTTAIRYQNFGTNLTNSTFQVQDWMAFRWVAKGYIR